MPAQLSAQPAAVGAAPVSSAPSDSGESSTSELPDGAGTKPADQTGAAEEPSSERAGNRELSEEEQEVVAELKKRDREVREHEQAHLASAGQYARGGAQFEYQTGPDGHRYAVGRFRGTDAGSSSLGRPLLWSIRFVFQARQPVAHVEVQSHYLPR
jgi:hypothetical protein